MFRKGLTSATVIQLVMSYAIPVITTDDTCDTRLWCCWIGIHWTWSFPLVDGIDQVVVCGKLLGRTGLSRF